MKGICIHHMEAIREIQTVEKGQIHLNLPKQFWGQQVEIIILSLIQQKPPVLQRKSLRGCLQQYANPVLISNEKDAWQNAVEEKHGYH